MYYGVNCKVEGCASDAVSKGMCRRCYKQVYTHGENYKGRLRRAAPKPQPIIIPTDGIAWAANKGNSLADCYFEI
jgi:hypothetical protein